MSTIRSSASVSPTPPISSPSPHPSDHGSISASAQARTSPSAGAHPAESPSPSSTRTSPPALPGRAKSPITNPLIPILRANDPRSRQIPFSHIKGPRKYLSAAQRRSQANSVNLNGGDRPATPHRSDASPNPFAGNFQPPFEPGNGKHAVASRGAVLAIRERYKNADEDDGGKRERSGSTRHNSPLKRARAGTVTTTVALESPKKKAKAKAKVAAQAVKMRANERGQANDLEATSQRPHRKGARRDPVYISSLEPEPWTLCPPSEAKANMPPFIAEQYELAGLQYHAPLPRWPFPHADLNSFEYEHQTAPLMKRRRIVLTKDEREAELAKLKPPPLGQKPGSSENQGPPKERARAALMAIMERMVSEGDYKRASRAFGLLLRTKLHGKAMELRASGLWGVGVDILLREDWQPPPPRLRPHTAANDTQRGSRARKAKIARRQEGGKWVTYRKYYSDSEDEERELEEVQESADRLRKWKESLRQRPDISEEAWNKARDFFEFLIMQFPNVIRDKTGRMNAFEFYYHMYSTWILHIEAMRRFEERRVHQDYRGEIESQHLHESNDGGWLDFDPDNKRLVQALGAVVEAMKERVQALTEHMDEVVETLPWSDDHDLIALRAKVERMLAELCVPLDVRLRNDFSHSDIDDYDEEVHWSREVEYRRDGRVGRPGSDGDESSADGSGVEDKVQREESNADVSGAEDEAESEGSSADRSGAEDKGGSQESSFDGSDAKNELDNEPETRFQKWRDTRNKHRKKARRLMNVSAYLKRTAHLRASPWGAAWAGDEWGDNKEGVSNGSEADDDGGSLTADVE